MPDHPDGVAAYGDRAEITHTIVPDQRGYASAQTRHLALLVRLPAPTIIRTVEELEALDPETIVTPSQDDMMTAEVILGRDEAFRVARTPSRCSGRYRRADPRRTGNTGGA